MWTYPYNLVPAVEKSGPDTCGKTGDICIILCGMLYLYFNFNFVIILVGFFQDRKKRTKLGALDGGHIEQS